MLPRGRLGVLRLPGARISAALLMTLLAVVSFVLAGAKSARADWNDDYPYSGGAIGAKDPWGFYTRECTSFVAFRLINRNGDTGFHGPIGYGAQDWGTVYASITNHNPAPGSVAWWSSGHVAWVESVSGSNVTIEEYNWNYNHNFNERTISASNPTGFIHFKDIPASSPPPPNPYDPKLRAAPHLSADFTGDGKPDVAVLYDYGNNDTALLVFKTPAPVSRPQPSGGIRSRQLDLG